MTLKRRIQSKSIFRDGEGFDKRPILDRAFDALRQQDEPTQNAIAQTILELIDVLTPEPCEQEADEVDEELEYLTSMTDEQYHAMQQWLINRHAKRLTIADIKADTMEG